MKKPLNHIVVGDVHGREQVGHYLASDADVAVDVRDYFRKSMANAFLGGLVADLLSLFVALLDRVVSLSLLGSVVSSVRLWGCPDDRGRHWRCFVGGFAGLVLALLLTVVVGRQVSAVAALVTLVYDFVLPAVLFVGPPVVSAASAYRDGGLFASFTVGATPGLLFSVVVALTHIVTGQVMGDTPLLAVAVAFVSIGVASALLGYIAGCGLRRLADRRSQQETGTRSSGRRQRDPRE